MAKRIELIDFHAEWCGPCKVMNPIINSLMEEYNKDGSDVEIKKSDVDEETDLAAEYGIRSIPTLVFLKDGSEVYRISGTQRKEELVNKIEELLKD
jgi:thioredoxin 1